jgi:F0F1-type ATP synthase membrane subunit b/b'
MPQLDTTYYASSVAWFLLCFGALFLLSQFWLIPKLNRLALQRKEEASSKLNEILLLRDELARFEEQYKNQLDLINREIKQISSEMVMNFNKEAEEILKDIVKSCDLIVADEEKKMNAKFDLLLQDKEQIAGMLAEAFVSKRKSLNDNQLKH